MTTTYYPFRISRQDVDYSTTLALADIGRWVIIMNGAYHFVSGPEPIVL